MNQDGRNVMLLTRWVLGDDCENDHRGMLPIYDDVDICEERARDLGSHGKNDEFGEFDTGGHEATSQSEEVLNDTDPAGGWIVEVGKDYDLKNANAPNAKRLARSYRLYKIIPVILF
jgi:hypothetical protein